MAEREQARTLFACKGTKNPRNVGAFRGDFFFDSPHRTVQQRTFKRIEGITPQKYLEDLDGSRGQFY